MIEISHLSYTYPGATTPALDDITLVVRPGERVALVGANGSGKSTLLHYLAGLLPLQRESPLAAQPALVFQSPDDQAVAPSVIGELAFNLEQGGWVRSPMLERLAVWASRFGLTALADRDLTRLSGGEQQTVALAAATIDQRPVLLLDEPESWLDTDGRTRLADALSELRTALPELIEVRVTQSQETADDYERVIALRNGRLMTDPAAIATVLCPPLPTSSVSGFESPPETGWNLEGVSFSRPETGTVFRDVTTAITGRIIAIDGRNGSGKTTLLRLLAGLIVPTAGQIRLRDGRRVTPPGSDAYLVGQLPERQFFCDSVADELRFGLRRCGRHHDDEILRRVLDRVGLTVDLSRDPLSLSGGEQRRLALAIALSLQPSRLLCDEPTAALDNRGRALVAEILASTAANGTQIVIVSHDALMNDLADMRYTIREKKIVPTT